MAITKAQARKVRQPTLSGDYALSAALDAAMLVDIVSLSCASQMITVQSDGNLAGTIEISINGQNFGAPIAFAANVMVSYSTNLVRVIRVTRTGGAGRLHVAAAG